MKNHRYSIFCVALLLTLGLSTLQAQTSRLQILAKKVTVDKLTSGEKQIGKNASTQLTQKQMAYEFSIRNASADALGATVRWTLYREGAGGRLTPAGKGEKSGTFAAGRTVKIVTDPIQISARDIDAKRRSTSVSEELKGYAMTISDRSGNIIARKTSSVDIDKLVGLTAGTQMNAPGKRANATRKPAKGIQAAPQKKASKGGLLNKPRKRLLD